MAPTRGIQTPRREGEGPDHAVVAGAATRVGRRGSRAKARKTPGLKSLALRQKILSEEPGSQEIVLHRQRTLVEMCGTKEAEGHPLRRHLLAIRVEAKIGLRLRLVGISEPNLIEIGIHSEDEDRAARTTTETTAEVWHAGRATRGGSKGGRPGRREGGRSGR